MKYTNIQKLKDEEFRRATGVKRKTFHLMLEVLNKEEQRKLEVVQINYP